MELLISIWGNYILILCGKIHKLVICLALVVFISSWSTSITASDGVSSPTSGPLNGVSFNQVDFIWQNHEQYNSAVGEVVADIDAILTPKKLDIGYLNGYTLDGWVIQNLLLNTKWSHDSVSTFFDLGRTGEVRSIQMYLQVTGDPLQRCTGSTFETYMVGDIVYDAEGDTDGPGIGMDITPPSPNAVEFDVSAVNVWYEQPSHHPDANVECAVNQCVTTGYANTMQYLENTFPVNVPHQLIPGIGFYQTGIVVPSTSLSGYFDVLMERNVVNWTEGSGTPTDRALLGALRYCWEEDIDVTVRHQGYDGDGDVVWDGKKTSYHEGEPVNFMYLMTEIKQGHGVTLRYWRFNNSHHYGGHQICVVGAGYIGGVAAINYCHDSKQSNITDGLKVVQSFIGLNTSDGNLTLLNAGNPPDGPPEIVRIVTFDAHNQGPATPTPPHQGFGIITLKKDIDYEFTTSTTDPEGHDLYYEFDWGDGTFTEVGPFASGVTISATHNWSDLGSIVSIKVRARDIFYKYSNWSESAKRVIPGFELFIFLFTLIAVFLLLLRKHQTLN